MQQHLEDATYEGVELYILADTSFGSEGVDEIAAEHVGADAMIRFGSTLPAIPAHLPVLFCYGQYPCDIERCIQAVNEFSESVKENGYSIVVAAEPCLQHVVRELKAHTDKHSIHCVDLPEELDPDSPSDSSEYSIGLNSNNVFVYLAPQEMMESDATPSLLMQVCLAKPEQATVGLCVQSDQNVKLEPISQCDDIALEEKSSQISSKISKALQQRFVLLQKARLATTIGIVVTTLSVRGYETITNCFRELIRKAGKKEYVLLVGKPNPYKLANFDNIDCFILIGSGESVLLSRDRQREYPAPVIAPWEALLALSPLVLSSENAIEWDGKVLLNMESVIDRLNQCLQRINEEASNDQAEDADAPIFSPYSGQYIERTKTSHDVRTSGETSLQYSSGELSKKEETADLVFGKGSGAQHLVRKEWQGITYDTPETASQIEEGSKGIARGYSYERDDVS